ncbi:MAG: response regulator [Desulfobacteraceae bacterium]|nr:MAG: response regulator [Desulfobacteraceae bacterium]
MIDLETMSILVVDDMKSMRLTIRKMLKHLGIGRKIQYAANGQEGMGILHNSSIDLAIIDWNMPVMNGTELLNYIRNDRAFRDMPVIMVTAEADKNIVYEVAETEIDAYLLKPLTLEALDSKIRQVVDEVNNPNPGTIHLLKARDYEEIGRYAEAIEETRQALKYKPSASRILRKLGLLHFKIDKFAIGLKCLQKAASVNRNDAVTRYHISQYYLNRHDLINTTKYYMEMLTISDKYIPESIDLGERLLQSNKSELGIQLFEQALNRRSKNMTHKEQVVDISMENFEFEYAVKLLKQLIKEFPSKYEYVFTLGKAYLHMEKVEAALENFILADENIHNHIEAKVEIAKIYFQLNRFIVADQYINQILKSDPGNPVAMEMRKKF